MYRHSKPATAIKASLLLDLKKNFFGFTHRTRILKSGRFSELFRLT